MNAPSWLWFLLALLILVGLLTLVGVNVHVG